MANDTLEITVGMPGATAAEIEDFSRGLWNELRGLDVEDVRPAAKEAEEGSKAGLAIDWSTLLVTLAASGGVLVTLINVVKDYLARNQAANVRLKIGDDELEISGPGPYSDAQKRAIEAWLSRHRGFVVAG